MKKNHSIIALILLVLLPGCAEIDTPQPAQIIKNPIGTSSVKIGMTKTRVISLYGDPDVKSIVTSKEWESEREEWFYRARLDGLPVSADYLAQDQYLYFDGDSLTNISSTPMGKAKEERTDAGKEHIK